MNNNQDGNNGANGDGNIDPFKMADAELIRSMVQFSCELKNFELMNEILYEDLDKPEKCEQMKARVMGLKTELLVKYIQLYLAEHKTTLEEVKRIAKEHNRAAVSYVLGLGNDKINKGIRTKVNNALKHLHRSLSPAPGFNNVGATNFPGFTTPAKSHQSQQGSHHNDAASSVGSLTTYLDRSNISGISGSSAYEQLLNSEQILKTSPLGRSLHYILTHHVQYGAFVTDMKQASVSNPVRYHEISVSIAAEKEDDTRRNYAQTVEQQLLYRQRLEESIKAEIDPSLQAAKDIPTRLDIDIAKKKADAANQILAIKEQLDRDVSSLIQDAKHCLKRHVAPLEAYNERIIDLDNRKKQDLTLALARNQALQTGHPVLSLLDSLHNPSNPPAEEMIPMLRKECDEGETRLKELQHGIYDNDLESLMPLVWGQALPAVVDVASIWEKLGQVENDSKKPSGTIHY